MRRLIGWFFDKPAPVQESPTVSREDDWVRPTDEYIKAVVAGKPIFRVPPRQYCNWASRRLGLEDYFTTESRVTPRVFWILYEACRQELNDELI